jgi:hypothetical protein
MAIKRVVSRQEADEMIAKGDKCAGQVREIISKLKENPGSLVEVDSADLAPIRNKITYMKSQGIDNDVKHLNVIKIKADDNQVSVLVEWLNEIPEPVVKKKKVKKAVNNTTETAVKNNQ